MPENETPTLQTERLILRDFKEEDWRDIHEYDADAETVKYMPFGPNTEDETKAFINKTIDRRKESPRLIYNFAMVIKSDNKVIGSFAINITDLANKEAMIGYLLNRNYWNQGYTTEAARSVLAFGFEQLGLHRIIASCDPANTGSYRVMEKLGMQREGYMREEKLFKGVWRDFLLYSILEKEWHNRKEKPAEIPETKNETPIKYLEKNQNELNIIGPLWEKLNAHHISLSKYWGKNRRATSFDMRKKQLLEKSQEGKLCIFLASDVNTKKYIGYCVTTVDRENQGEIESIYVENDYRGLGIGDSLMIKALDWLKAMKVTKTILSVGDGNENVFAFYRRYNFYPRVTILWHKPDSEFAGKQ